MGQEACKKLDVRLAPAELFGRAARVNAVRALAVLSGNAERKFLETLAAGPCDQPLEVWPVPFRKWNDVLSGGNSLDVGCWAKAALSHAHP